jgi:NhaP-type Na+/H+ or K+/H+ antiporter
MVLETVLSTDEIIAGLGLVIVLALGCELVAVRTRLPAILLLLPVGFIAGAATRIVHPDELFGATFQPLVSIGVGLILFEAGLRLRLDELEGGVRRVVIRLIPLGTMLTAIGATLAVRLVFGISWGASIVLGAVLVVSGPTVVLPLLAFVRPSDRVRSLLKWEGVLIDPIGALLGVLAFHVVKAGAGGDRPFHVGSMLTSIGVGLLAGAIGAALLWLLLRGIQRASPAQGIAAALVCVVGALVAADLIKEDSGFVAATAMGMVMANQRRLDVSKVLEFQATIVGLMIGILFVLISASVTPSTVSGLLPDGLVLIAVMVLVIRPLVIFLGTRGSDLGRAEKAFMAWLAPRGIVAAATASAFGPQLAQAGVGGADKVLPIAFIAIFGTVVIYGLTAAPLAKRLRLAGASADVVLVIGGHRWAQAIARALQSAGLGVRLWTGRAEEQAAARAAGLAAGNARLGADAASREAELEEVTDALLLTDNDDFNALAAFELRRDLGNDHVYRLAAGSDLLDIEPAYAEGRTLFTAELTHAELTRRFEAGGELVSSDDVDAGEGEGMTPLFVVSATGELRVVRAGRRHRQTAGETTIWLAERPRPPRPPSMRDDLGG